MEDKRRKMKQNIGFHGEITYTPDVMPEGENKKVRSLIIGHSETGHHHVLECDTEFDRIMTDNGIYVLLHVEARLYHKKDHDIHETRILQPGAYRFGEKTEYDPFNDVIREVHD